MLKQIGVALVLTIVAGGAAQAAKCPEHKTWEGILRANVDAEGFVDYNGVRINRGGDLLEYLFFMETADLTTCSDAEKIAFWINVYNATVVKKILSQPKLEKLSDDPKFFTERNKVARMQLSLNDIQHRILRSAEAYGGPIENVSLGNVDPRVNFALCAGAVDSPRLVNRIYAAKVLPDMLQAAAIHFANKPNHLRVENGRLVMSSIAKLYEDDFKRVGGVPAFFSSLTDAKLRADEADVDARLASDFPNNTDFRYDWVVNSIQNRPPSAPVKK